MLSLRVATSMMQDRQLGMECHMSNVWPKIASIMAYSIGSRGAVFASEACRQFMIIIGGQETPKNMKRGCKSLYDKQVFGETNGNAYCTKSEQIPGNFVVIYSRKICLYEVGNIKNIDMET